eukprot:CAMPEP_0168321494 /NCGR_PEP_ID=MMETSP0213-20121227/2308_1 /TAXON_ID=151035 /ORGANISM="Euplotes harpa, Strain FSP1.4" /LENGTH=86 /DNA_ID=CAMNT_0008323163 /DNA_START=816 /DNA_END=1077 /DNA_ORIENTATION=+
MAPTLSAKAAGSKLATIIAVVEQPLEIPQFAKRSKSFSKGKFEGTGIKGVQAGKEGGWTGGDAGVRDEEQGEREGEAEDFGEGREG